MVTGRENVPVDRREGVSSTVSIEDGGLLVDMDGLRHPPPEPVRLLMQDGDFFVRKGVAVPLQMMANGRGRFVVFCHPLAQLPLRFPDIGGATVCTLNVVHQACLVLLVQLVLRVDQAPADGVVRAKVHCHPCLADGTCNGLRYRSHIRQRDVTPVTGFCGFTWDCGFDLGCGGCFPGRSGV